MSKETDIEWADSTVNPTERCDGCELWNPKKDIRVCYAGRMTERYHGEGSFQPPAVLKPGRMEKAAKWDDLRGLFRPEKPWLGDSPRIIFVGDMADIFSKDVPFEFIHREVFGTARHSSHIYILLTKQAARLAEFVRWCYEEGRQFERNVWMGVSVTSHNTLGRIRALEGIHNAFVSYGPVMDPAIFTNLQPTFKWMIIEGQSGPNPVELSVKSAREALEWCRKNNVAPFIKQMGSAWAKKYGSETYKGNHMEEWPEDIRVRRLPWVA